MGKIEMLRKIKDTYQYLRNDRYGKWLLALVWLGIGLAAAFCGIKWMKFVCYTPLLLDYKNFVLASGARLPIRRRWKRPVLSKAPVTVK